MAAIGLIGGLFSFMGSMAAADAARQQGAYEQQSEYYKAGMEERQAMAERATYQRRASDQQREEKYLQSTLQAKAAASGAGATDPTVVNLAGQIAGESKYRQLGEMWSGKTRATE